VLTENGVDTELFQPTQPINTDRNRPLNVGFSGSKDIAKHDSLKGFSEFILPLNEIPNVKVHVLGGRGEQQVKREDMPPLYNQIDLYICASTSEGFSQSVLEASACGRGIISTKVGGSEDLIEENHNGFFINRDITEIKKLVTRLEADRLLVKKLGENNRQKIVEQYAWNIRVQEWLAFIESNLPRCEVT
jgi:glycosyltransferase involved in cell wall biosynthesis